MLEKPNIADEMIVTCLETIYNLIVVQLDFLPIGADIDTAVYRAITADKTAYFVKLRSGKFDEMTILVPKYLHDMGLQYVIPPLATSSQALWADLQEFKVAVFPFVDGYNGYEGDLSDQHWIDLGRAFKILHTTQFPAHITHRIQRETFSSEWRDLVMEFLQQDSFIDEIAQQLGTFLKQQRAVIHKLVYQAETLATVLQQQSLPFVVCHADCHAGNVLIDSKDKLYIIDWDTLILAPKERDLMYAGGGQFVNKRTVAEEQKLFYQGYGQVGINQAAIVYYQYERIVQDIAEYGQQILLSAEGEQDRKKGLHQLMSQFDADGVVQIAFKSARQLSPEDQTD